MGETVEGMLAKGDFYEGAGGTLTFPKAPRYECPKHGNMGGIIGISLHYTQDSGDIPGAMLGRTDRRYCWACWVDMMDQFMCELVEVPAAD